MKYKKSIFQKYLKSKKNPYLYDIFKESRLYASNYTELNDLEEGYFYYDVNEKKDMSDIESVFSQKLECRICSFSKERKGDFNPLMWAHYADGGRGIMINFKINEPAVIDKVKYDGHYHYDQEEDIREIFIHKVRAWNYEKEYRVITKKTYVKIKIESVVLGPRFNSSSEYICTVPDGGMVKSISIKELLEENNIPVFKAAEYYNRYIFVNNPLSY